MRLDNYQPRSESHFIAVERIEDVKATEKLESQKHERTLVGQFFEAENLEVPIEGAVQQVRYLSWNFEFRNSGAGARLATGSSRNDWFIRTTTRGRDLSRPLLQNANCQYWKAKKQLKVSYSQQSSN